MKINNIYRLIFGSVLTLVFIFGISHTNIAKAATKTAYWESGLRHDGIPGEYWIWKTELDLVSRASGQGWDWTSMSYGVDKRIIWVEKILAGDAADGYAEIEVIDFYVTDYAPQMIEAHIEVRITVYSGYYGVPITFTDSDSHIFDLR